MKAYIIVIYHGHVNVYMGIITDNDVSVFNDCTVTTALSLPDNVIANLYFFCLQ